jgi:hypothetical protein
MRVDRPRREEQLRRDLLVRQALGHETRDLQLLGRQLVDRARVALARRLSGGTQFRARPLGPRLGAQPLEALDGRAKLNARVGAAPLAA